MWKCLRKDDIRSWFICANYPADWEVRLEARPWLGCPRRKYSAAVKKDHREFQKDDSVIKQHFNYLKYVNGSRTKTWIIYFTDEDICKTSKLICDYSEFDEDGGGDQ